MLAKIMLLPSSSKGKTLCSYAEELFLEISASFGHSLNTVREKIGEDSLRLFDAPLTQETVDACKKCSAVFLADADCPGSKELYRALGIPIRVRSFVVPGALGAENVPARNWYMAQAAALDADTVFSAVRQAVHLSNDAELPFSHVSPTGNNRFTWEAHVKETLKKYPALSFTALSGPDAARKIVESPYTLGVLLCPPYAGGILESAATSLFPYPGIQYDFGLLEEKGVYAPRMVTDDNDIPQPFGTAYAIARMLRESLHLHREAACLEAAIHNVLVSGWRSPGMAAPGQATDGSHIIQLICEQLAVAGELINKGSDHP